MSSLDEFKAVDRSLDSFKALRDGLGYLRSISVCFELDEVSQNRLFTLMASRAMATDGTFNSDEADELSRSYFQTTVALMYSLLFAALQHYMELIETNTQLKHEELEATLPPIHRTGACERPPEETKGCASESGIMILEQKPAWKQGAPNSNCLESQQE